MKIEPTPNNNNDVILENTSTLGINGEFDSLFNALPNTSTVKAIDGYKGMYDAFELYNLEIDNVPKLLDPFFQKVGLASLVGTSDSGKSTFLRQLSLSIVLQKETFIGCKLNCKSNKVIYVSTEDDSNSVSAAIRKQIQYLMVQENNLDFNLLKNLKFIFNTENLLDKDAFAKMKKSCIFLNLGRGPIVVEQDLYDALITDEIAAAGLDVLCQEPMSEQNPLFQIKDSRKLLITPHIAWAGIEARIRLMDIILNQIKDFFEL